MALKLPNILGSAILWCYFALAVTTPFLFSTYNSELFEVPKMFFVYFLAVVIGTLTTIKFIQEKKIRLPVDLVTGAFVIFLLVQIASTITSIDRFTSIFGYPSRLNGGLLSQFAYFVIFTTALINLNYQSVKKLIVAVVISAFVVALWGIPGHFGADPNCFVLTGNLTSTCWQAEFDPTKRIFSTLGQPNWLASYLVLVLPLAASQIFTTKIQNKKVVFAAASIVIFIAFIFTNSRAGLFGLVAAIGAFTILFGAKRILKNLKAAFIILFLGIVSVLFFGQQLILRIGQITSPGTSVGTESSQIRLIVWKGALEVAKKYPILGTGPETFAYSYYQVRPLAHNQTTEWNFFYNKAHNEFLNYLANIGSLGLASYLILIFAALHKIAKISRNPKEPGLQIPTSAIFSGVIGYQASIFFGFGVTATQLLMFMLIAFAVILGKETKFKEVNLALLKNRLPGPKGRGSLFFAQNSLHPRLESRSFFAQNKILLTFATGAVGIFGLYLAVYVARLFIADVLENRAKNSSWESPQALLLFEDALFMSPVKNPFYLSDAANAFANYASVQEENAAKTTMEQSEELASESLEISPQNIIIARRLANVYILLSGIDQSFYNEALKIGEKITSLAPTDPQSYLTLAKIQIATEENEKARVSLQKALDLKPDYVEAQELLEQLTTDI